MFKEIEMFASIPIVALSYPPVSEYSSIRLD